MVRAPASVNGATSALIGGGVAFPESRFTTKRLAEAVGDLVTPALLESLRRTGVEARYSVVANLDQVVVDAALPLTLTTTATELALDAARAAVRDAAVGPGSIGLVVAATNSQAAVLPGLAHDLLGQDGGWLPRSAALVNMQGQGCAVGLKALEVATWFTRANPGKNALVVGVEAQTAMLASVAGRGLVQTFSAARADPGDPDGQTRRTLALMQAFLFGDGAAALVVGEGVGLRPAAFTHSTNAEADDVALAHLRDGGSAAPRAARPGRFHMSARMPERGAAYVRETARMIRPAQLELLDGADPQLTLVHTGSMKILRGVHIALGIDPGGTAVAPSYEVLRNHGNLSAASMLAMLATNLQAASIAAYAFGVGFSASATVLVRRTDG